MVEKYNIQKTEKKWRKFWERMKVFKTDWKRKGQIYSIDTPPPSISGRMHIGHAFSYAQQDFIIRFRRMKGNVFYPFGTDDNGLPTERFIEKINNVRSKDMSRSKFIALCLKTLKKQTLICIEDFKILGVSADYDVYYSTINKNSRRISQKSFIELFNKGLIYKKQFPTIWCPECQTAIAQAELEDKEKETTLNYLKGKMEDGSFIIYATTRPELHPGCVGISLDQKGDYVKVKIDNGEVWIISNDSVKEMKEEFPMEVIKRFKGKDLIGKKVEIRFSEQPVYISHDVSAKTDYGTGIVYYCSYGGLDCVLWLTRHPEAKAISIMDEFGIYTKGPCKGMKSDAAREKILELLDKEGYLIKKEKMKHSTNVHDKCGTSIEYIQTEQWFIKILDKKKKLIEQGEKIKWYPEFMFKRYKNWINGLEWDWSISRNRHFGIPIPVWECKKCNEILLPNKKDLPVDPIQIKKRCSKCNGVAEPETRVLDTWTTSSLTPQIASDLIGNKIKIPFSLRPQAHDIIRTWAFYTIVKSLYHENKIPWKNIMISGFVTHGGKKMSKSKGTGVQPQEVFEKHGADALRFWAAGSKLGEDLDYQEKDLITGKRFINKLFNASRFVFINLKDYDGKKPKKLENLDKEFLKHLSYLVKNVTGSFERYNYSVAKSRVEKFFWHDFCDNYLEIIKRRIYNEKGDKKVSAQYTLYKSLLTILKLIAPIMPFITEEIYQNHFRKREKDKSIHLNVWPNYEKNAQPSNFFTMFCDLLVPVRQEKTKAKKPMNVEIILTMDKKYKQTLEIEEMLEDFKNVSGACLIKTGKFKVEFVNR